MSVQLAASTGEASGVVTFPVALARVEKNVDGPKRLIVAVNRGPNAGDAGGLGIGYLSLDSWSDKSGEDGGQKIVTPILNQQEFVLHHSSLFHSQEKPYQDHHSVSS